MWHYQRHLFRYISNSNLEKTYLLESFKTKTKHDTKQKITKTKTNFVSVVYLPSLCTNESWVRFPVLVLMCMRFPVQACFCRFPWFLWFSLLHLKLGFFDNSVSGYCMEVSLKFIAYALLDFPGFLPNVRNINKK